MPEANFESFAGTRFAVLWKLKTRPRQKECQEQIRHCFAMLCIALHLHFFAIALVWRGTGSLGMPRNQFLEEAEEPVPRGMLTGEQYIPRVQAKGLLLDAITYNAAISPPRPEVVLQLSDDNGGKGRGGGRRGPLWVPWTA